MVGDKYRRITPNFPFKFLGGLIRYSLRIECIKVLLPKYLNDSLLQLPKYLNPNDVDDNIKFNIILLPSKFKWNVY